MKTETKKVFCKYVFSDKEKTEISMEMAQKVSDCQIAEDTKKAVMSDLKSQIDGLQAGINGAAVKLNNGYEMRNIDCTVEYDYTSGTVSYRRVDNGMVAKVRDMDSDEKQRELFPDNQSE